MQKRHSCLPLIAVVFSALCVNLPSAVSAQDADAGAAKTVANNGNPSGDNDLLDMDIEQLRKTSVAAPSFDVEVTSVTKQKSTVGRSAAAIFVITPEMIRRSGCTTIPDLLRMVPGMEVAQINSHSWAVSCRGYNGRFATSLLVLIDGRSVYSDFFGGTYWDVQDTLFEDIERIEVIRGPGGTLWGANAVDGVVNIITKKTQDTQGTLVTVGGGNWDKVIDAFRVGGTGGNGFHWRIYGKHFERGAEYEAGGAHDDWRMGRGGFRLDWDLDKHDTDKLTVLGNYYGGREGQDFLNSLPYPPYNENLIGDVGVSGANVLARWNHRIDSESDWKLQVYFDRAFRDESVGKIQMNTLDIDFQHCFPLSQRQKFIWGLDCRQVHDYLPTDSFFIKFSPQERTVNLFSGFLQDEITLVEDRLFFTLGTKLEQNSYSGFECQPSVRLLWSPDDTHAFWGAISKPVRTPSRVLEDSTINVGPISAIPLPTFVRFMGNPDLKAESVMVYELGYRAQPTERFSWDVAGYYNRYENIIWGQTGTPFGENSYLVVPFPMGNGWRYQSYGIEISGQWTVSERWRVSGWYNAMKLEMENVINPTETYLAPQNTACRNQVRLQSSWDIGHDWEFDVNFRYVDKLMTPSAPAYLTMDMRLGWSPNKNLEWALVGRNLLDNHHPESGYEGFGYTSDEVRRTVFTQLTWRR
ncbi:MAG: TonB-dependent receptor [Pirellulales bacterium]|nr:TonB-dependent receptor [Pirellulales bacterium]